MRVASLVCVLLLILEFLGVSGRVADECCDAVASENEHALLACVNSSLARNNEAKLASALPMATIGAAGPSLVVAFVTRATSNIYSYAAYSLFAQAVYADEHGGYVLLPLQEDSPTPDYTYHRKLVPILETMERSVVKDVVDYIVWIDADVVLLDLALRIEAIAARHPQAHLLLSADVSSLANTGMMIIKNTPWAKRFLHKWLDERTNSQTDQHGFEAVYHQHVSQSKTSKKEKSGKKIVFLAPDCLNSDSPPMGRQKDNSQVLHLAAETNELRQSIFKAGAKELCRARRSGEVVALKHQLGITRSFLQQETARVNRIEAELIMEQVSAACRLLDQHDVKATIPLSLLLQLRVSSSKLCHAIRYANNERETRETITIREKTHELVSKYAQTRLQIWKQDRQMKRRGEGGNHHQRMNMNVQGEATIHSRLEDVPEELKLSAEIAYELLNALEDKQQALTLVEYIHGVLDELLQMVHPSQLELIMGMKADLLSFTGSAALLQGDADEAHRLLAESIEMYSTLQSGDLRAKFNAQSLYAASLCQRRVNSDKNEDQEEKAMALFETTIQDEIAHVGQLHHNLASKYLNMASCALKMVATLATSTATRSSSSNKPKSDVLTRKAIGLLKEAIRVAESNKHILEMQRVLEVAHDMLRKLT